MKIKFKKVNDSQIYTIEGESLAVIKVALVVNYGQDQALQLFQHKVTHDILHYYPTKRDLDNLAKRSFDGFVRDHSEAINEAVKSIKPLEDE